MDLKAILEIINNEFLADFQKEKAICIVIARDSTAIPVILRILDAEREEKNKLVTDLNLFLSKAHVGLEEPKLNKDGFMQKEIADFYKSGRIGHCFKQIEPELNPPAATVTAK
jgi:hypothetical protein